VLFNWRTWFLFLEKSHVEHRNRTIQPIDRRGMGRTLQGDLWIRLWLLEDCDISVFRRRVRVHDIRLIILIIILQFSRILFYEKTKIIIIVIKQWQLLFTSIKYIVLTLSGLPFSQSGHWQSGRLYTVAARVLHGNTVWIRHHRKQGGRTRTRGRPADFDHLHEKQIW